MLKRCQVAVSQPSILLCIAVDSWIARFAASDQGFILGAVAPSVICPQLYSSTVVLSRQLGHSQHGQRIPRPTTATRIRS